MQIFLTFGSESETERRYFRKGLAHRYFINKCLSRSSLLLKLKSPFAFSKLSVMDIFFKPGSDKFLDAKSPVILGRFSRSV
jgi:hypothetical protein